MALYQFPGTDFHDLNLDWLLQQMKACLADWATTKTQWESVAAEWEDLKEFVTNYFNDLDVSQEISDKIDAMAADGSLLAVIQETVATSAADEAGDWLTEHITAISGYVIDNTLMTTSAAADAKVTGIFARRNTSANDAEAMRAIAGSMLQRGYNSGTGSYTTNTYRAHTDEFTLSQHQFIEARSGFKFGVYTLEEGETTVESGWVEHATLYPGNRYIIGVRKVENNVVITANEAVAALSVRAGGEIESAEESEALTQYVLPGWYNIRSGAMSVYTDAPAGSATFNCQLIVERFAAGGGDIAERTYINQILFRDNGGYMWKRVLQIDENGTLRVYVDWVIFCAETKLTGKTFSIMGDSVSTFTGYIPNGYATYYPHNGNNVTHWYDTYWGMLIQKAGMTLLVNDSYSGSRVSYSGSNGETYMAGSARVDALGSTAPDYMFILAGGNDANYTVDIGTFTTDMINLASVTDADAATFANAYKIMITRIKNKFPNTKLIILWYHNMSACPNSGHGGVNYGTQDAYAQIAEKAATLYGAQFIDLRKCGIDMFNNTTFDTANHPVKAGMEMYYNYLIQTMVM